MYLSLGPVFNVLGKSSRIGSQTHWIWPYHFLAPICLKNHQQGCFIHQIMICNHRTFKYLAENLFALPQNMISHDFTNQKPWMLPAFCQNWVRMIRMVGLIPVHQQRPAFCWSKGVCSPSATTRLGFKPKNVPKSGGIIPCLETKYVKPPTRYP